MQMRACAVLHGFCRDSLAPSVTHLPTVCVFFSPTSPAEASSLEAASQPQAGGGLAGERGSRLAHYGGLVAYLAEVGVGTE